MLFSGFWSENAALFESLMEIHSNPQIPYYGFKVQRPCLWKGVHFNSFAKIKGQPDVKLVKETSADGSVHSTQGVIQKEDILIVVHSPSQAQPCPLTSTSWVND